LALEPELVSLAIGLVSEERPSDDASADLANLLGSREELLAFLFTKTNFLKLHPDIRQAVQELAATHGNHAVTKRLAAGAPAKARDISSQMREEVLSVVDNDLASMLIAARFDALDRQHALYSSEDSPFENSPEKWFARDHP
jgi:hypothetical protein